VVYDFRMARSRAFLATVFALAVLPPAHLPAQGIAPAPPLGWNSWDAYGLTIDEAGFRANATVLAQLREFGWEYAVIDEGWYMQDPFSDKLETRKYVWDLNGILIPAANRFPSSAAGAGFKPLADWVHAKGLKFGIHIVRGIPRQVVKDNLPIAGSNFHAADAADLTSPCPWDDGNWGIKDNAAGQAYYDSMIALYAKWGLDFLKVDCISDHPYRVSEIRQIAEAIRKSGRPIVLSLSPGPTQLEHADEVAKYAQMWRITNDHWDAWKFERHTPDGYPMGIAGEFDVIAQWAPHAGPGHWPDADMLPEGWIGPHPGMGEARQSRLTPDEQRTEFTLWAIARSPLILGGNLTKLDDFTRSLMTNEAILGANQHTDASSPITKLPAGFEGVRVWVADSGLDCGMPYIAFFNLAESPSTLHFRWDQFPVLCQGWAKTTIKRKVINLWDGTKTDSRKPMDLSLPPHGSAIFRLD